MKWPRRVERSASNARRRSWSVMAVEVSPGMVERQPTSSEQSAHMRPSAPLPPRVSGSGPSRSSVGAFPLLLGTVLLLVAGGILWVYLVLGDAVRAESRHDAAEVRLLLLTRVTTTLESLTALRGLFIDDRGADAERFRMLLGTDTAASVARAGMERLLVVDSSGAVLHDTTFTPGAVADAAATLDVVRGTLHEPRARVAVTGRDRASRRIAIARPLVIDGRVVGAAVVMVRPDALVIPGAHDGHRLGITVLAGSDSVWSIGEPRREANPVISVASVILPGGDRWIIEAAHSRGGFADRWGPLALALLTLSLLAGGLLRERRQALRVTERSGELERLSSELLRANRMKSEFLANVSHELRTPLNAIVGFVELLRDGVYGELSPRQAQPVERIAASATHLRGLVDQVLDIAKMAAGRLEVHHETIVLRPFVLNVMSELESLVAEKGLSLSIAVGASLPRVRTDPAHLRSILVNLVGNAIKYTPSGGIVVRARLVGAPRATLATPVGERTLLEESALAALAPTKEVPWIALQVIDTGIGIAASDRERIFDEFEQVNAGPRGESMMRGTGLGLAITRRLARLLGGDVRVESEPGRGSTFTLWIPVSPADLGERKALG